MTRAKGWYAVALLPASSASGEDRKPIDKPPPAPAQTCAGAICTWSVCSTAKLVAVVVRVPEKVVGWAPDPGLTPTTEVANRLNMKSSSHPSASDGAGIAYLRLNDPPKEKPTGGARIVPRRYAAPADRPTVLAGGVTSAGSGGTAGGDAAGAGTAGPAAGSGAAGPGAVDDGGTGDGDGYCGDVSGGA